MVIDGREVGNTTISSSSSTSSSSSQVRNRWTTSQPSSSVWRGGQQRFILLFIHILTIGIYVYPLYISSSSTSTTNNRHHNEEAVLDELHIVSVDNKDINDASTTFYTIFTNDYWGRPLTYPASHKSWRPFTVLSFRYLRGIQSIGIRISDLMMHRFINIITHAATADLVGKLAVKLLVSPLDLKYNPSYGFWIFVITKLCFVLHPTHVEVVVNAANRSHILSVLLAVYASDPTIPYINFIISITCALLCSETALFHIIPISITILAISYIQKYHIGIHSLRPRNGNIIYQLVCTIIPQPNILFRLLWLSFAAVSYYGGRLYYNTLSIPEGLIRPAENPFFTLIGYTRFYSYIMVLGIHILKQYDYDIIGFSHEYGYNCIPPIHHWYNIRLLPAVFITFVHIAVAILFLLRQRRRRTISKGLLLFVVTLSWTFTLFPISGIVKVGTFISDRIVVPSTVPIAILQAYAITSWLSIGIGKSNNSSNDRKVSTWIDTVLNPRVQRKLLLLGIVLYFAWRRIHLRSLEWMNSQSLLESSLKTCPQFAKGHLEISKIYSGLYPEQYNLTRARYHLNEAERIDPNYCDVHFQFALLEAREHRYLPFEVRLVDALQCGFTMGQAHPIWHQYWPNILDETQQSPKIVAENRKRYESYMSILSKAIEKEEAKEKSKKVGNQSPLVLK